MHPSHIKGKGRKVKGILGFHEGQVNRSALPCYSKPLAASLLTRPANCSCRGRQMP